MEVCTESGQLLFLWPSDRALRLTHGVRTLTRHSESLSLTSWEKVLTLRYKSDLLITLYDLPVNRSATELLCAPLPSTYTVAMTGSHHGVIVPSHFFTAETNMMLRTSDVQLGVWSLRQ